MKFKHIFLTSIAASAISAATAATPLYLDENAPMEQRVEDALKRMTIEEKVAMCHAEGKFASAGVPRLGKIGRAHV